MRVLSFMVIFAIVWIIYEIISTPLVKIAEPRVIQQTTSDSSLISYGFDHLSVNELKKTELPELKDGYIRVASIQFRSRIAEFAENKSRLTSMIRQAAKTGAAIIAVPELAVVGGADIENLKLWSDGRTTEGAFTWLDIREAADFSRDDDWIRKLVEREKIWLAIGVVGEEEGKYYSEYRLYDPSGDIALTHRKTNKAFVADTFWMTTSAGFNTVQTPYGLVSLALGSEMPVRFMEDANVFLVLQGANLHFVDPELAIQRYQSALKRAGIAWIFANWVFDFETDWKGHGWSRIQDTEGKMVASITENPKEAILIQDIKLQ